MASPLQRLLLRGDHVCPWWLAYSFDNPLRRRLHPPERLFRGLVERGHVAVDVGCGGGHFTLGLARMVGPEGKVVAVDLQERMLERVRRRAERAGLLPRVRLHRCDPASLGLEVRADFVVASWMVHEVPDRLAFLRQLRALLKPGARLFVAEPRLHVSAAAFESTVALAGEAGLEVESRPHVALSRAVVLRNPGGAPA
jgi:ubiquinone/menaquinone biosynthesis C-methylase UbiE